MKKMITSAAVTAIIITFLLTNPISGQEQVDTGPFRVEPGDSWKTVSWRFGMGEADLRALNPHPNQQRMPAVGSDLTVPITNTPLRTGIVKRSGDGGLLQLSAVYGENPWHMSKRNGLDTPYRPLMQKAVILEMTGSVPRDLPPGLESLEFSNSQIHPGQAAAFKGTGLTQPINKADYGSIPVMIFADEVFQTGIFGTGAFFPEGDHELSIWMSNEPLWSQPWRMEPGTWSFEDIYLTGEAATITQEEITRERERLQALWSESSDLALWVGQFNLPLQQFLEYSSLYGSRRSYNGGPYRSYHEGLDFSAYGGTPVLAPAGGKIVLAELLDVRGGAVIIDHGLGVHSGFYHLSEILVTPGKIIEANQEIGKVGSTGLSTGNHLHWDLLIGTTWVDPAAWIENGTACWLIDKDC